MSTSEFFQQSSGRKERKRQRISQKKRRENLKREKQDDGDPLAYRFETPDPDTRTVRDILFPTTPEYREFLEHRKKQQKPMPKTFHEWTSVLKRAWIEYRSTWEGFFSNEGILVTDNHEETKSAIKEQKDQVLGNVRRNRRFLMKGSNIIRDEFTKRTGVENMQDFKDYIAGLMKLASECVKEFMQGYRKGRDDEVDKMLTQYFQDLREQANAPRKRRKKRRVLRNL